MICEDKFLMAVLNTWDISQQYILRICDIFQHNIQLIKYPLTTSKLL